MPRYFLIFITQRKTMQVTINFQSVADGLPSLENDPIYKCEYSVECLAVVDGEVFDRSVRFCFHHEGWVWGDMSLGYDPADYIQELGGYEPKVTHWAPWPLLVPAEVAA
jgi:hypothetical protein